MIFQDHKKKQLSWKSENAQESNEREKSRNPQTEFFFGLSTKCDQKRIYPFRTFKKPKAK